MAQKLLCQKSNCTRLELYPVLAPNTRDKPIYQAGAPGFLNCVSWYRNVEHHSCFGPLGYKASEKLPTLAQFFLSLPLANHLIWL